MKPFSILMLCLLLLSSAAFATDVSGNQFGTWTLAASPYNIVGDVTIPSGSTLSIEPGVHVLAMGNFRINAEGNILAIGTEADSIRFMNGQADPNALWTGIRMENPTTPSVITHCYIESATYGVNSVDSPVEISYCRFNKNQKGMQLYGIGNTNPAPMDVHHNIVERSIQNGILIPQNSNAHVHHNELRYNGTGTQYMAAIQLSNQSTGGANNPEIDNNWIHHNFKQGITAWDIVGANAINPHIHHNSIESNLTGIYLLNASGYVEENYIVNNFISGDTNSGAGVMVAGATSAPYFERNVITGNFTGFYLGTNAQPCLGDLSIYHAWAQGENQIYDNIDESFTLHSVYCYSYTNSAIVIKAENNFWGTDSPAAIAIGINDHLDDPALPTVDYEPFLDSIDPLIDINGHLAYQGALPLSTPWVDIVLQDSGEIFFSTSLGLDADFGLNIVVPEPFYLVFSAEVTGHNRKLYATAGTFTNPEVFQPGAIADLGTLLFQEVAPPSYEKVGMPALVGNLTIWPVYHYFFVYHWDYINWFYDSGDWRYIKRHTRYDDAQNTVFNLPDGTVWDKLANWTNGETYSRTEIIDASGTQRLSTISCHLVMDHEIRVGYNLFRMVEIGQTQPYCVSMRNAIRQMLFTIDGSYLDTQYELVGPDLSAPLVTGHILAYHPQSLSNAPTHLVYDPSLTFSYPRAVKLFWIPPAWDPGQLWQNYRLYLFPWEFLTLPFADPYWESDDLITNMPYWFTVCAWDGSSESAPTNLIYLMGGAGDDPAVSAPVLQIYPNPATLDGVNISLQAKSDLPGSLDIYNLRGQKVHSVSFVSTGSDILRWSGQDSHGSRCASGIYLLRIKLQGEKEISRRIVLKGD
jgi:hypothetical protein